MLYTIGHSNRTLDDFLSLLQAHGVQHLIDVRAFPRSRTNPQFNIDTLPEALTARGISYEHAPQLGGRRKQDLSADRDLNGFWTHDSFHAYADYALTPPFRATLAQVIEAGKSRATTVMCSEAVWWRCHRRIIADYLVVSGEDVSHIMTPNRAEPARLTKEAVVRPDRSIVYPAEQRSLLL